MALIRVAIKIATKETMMTMWRWESSPSLMITEEEKICVIFQSFSICQHWLIWDSFSSIFKGADYTDRKADSGSKSFSEILTEQRMTNIKNAAENSGNNLFFQNVFWVLLKPILFWLWKELLSHLTKSLSKIEKLTVGREKLFGTQTYTKSLHRYWNIKHWNSCICF